MTNASVLKSLARAQLALAAVLAAGVALAGQQAATSVSVKVKLVTSSGVCGALASQPAVHVSCTREGGPLLPVPGEVPFRPATLVPTAQLLDAAMLGDVVTERLPVYSDGTKISSWRVVQLDNARYLELTIAW
jgi:hypothetical protein